jgi:hypothetical protein
MSQNDTSSSMPSADYGPNVVFEEEECEDYVIVGGYVIDDGRGGAGGENRRLVDLLDDDDDEDDDGWDEVSYYDDDRGRDGGMSSPSLSCATSVATNVTLKDLHHPVDDASGVIAAGTDAAASMLSSSTSSTTMMMDVDDDDEEGMGGTIPMITDDRDYDDVGNAKVRGKDDSHALLGRGVVVPSKSDKALIAPSSSSSANPKNGRRLSNKKLRMKMKKLRKAAAARALAEQKAAVAASSASDAAMTNGVDVGGWASLAVACARESLVAYCMEFEEAVNREGGADQLVKTRTVSISE